MGWFSKYNKTNYEAGDLVVHMSTKAKEEEVVMEALATPNFVAPRKIDFRDMCLAASNQGTSPHCAGYSTAGFIEVCNWRTKHYPEQLDGDAIYVEAKKVDGFSGDGTYIWAAIKGAATLGLTDGKGKKVTCKQNDIKFALHQYGVCLAGFMITDEWNQVEKKTGRIRNLGDKAITRGGHAVLLCGYDESGVYIQNSWGARWGVYGFGLLSWTQFQNQIMSAMVIE